MDADEYLLALGRNRVAFAAIDYELALFGMSVDPDYQRRIDQPANRSEIPLSVRYVAHIVVHCEKLGLDVAIIRDLRELEHAWKPLCAARNNLAHAWGYGDYSTGWNQLAGVLHDFESDPPVHTPKRWSLADIEAMTEACRTLFGPTRSLRLRVKSALDSRT